MSSSDPKPGRNHGRIHSQALSGILTEVVAPDPTAFTPLVAKLANWRDELREAKQVYGRKKHAGEPG